MKSLFLALTFFGMVASVAPDQTIYQFTMKSIEGEGVSLSQYSGQVVMIVNVASKCGLTPQYEDLQALYDEMGGDDFVILGFPANNFMGQEPGTEDEIKSFCQKNYGVTFPMFSKIEVKGKDIHPLYQFLTEEERNGKVDADVSWNFQKFLIGKDGTVRASFSPRTKVTEPEVREMINTLLEEG